MDFLANATPTVKDTTFLPSGIYSAEIHRGPQGWTLRILQQQSFCLLGAGGSMPDVAASQLFHWQNTNGWWYTPREIFVPICGARAWGNI